MAAPTENDRPFPVTIRSRTLGWSQALAAASRSSCKVDIPSGLALSNGFARRISATVSCREESTFSKVLPLAVCIRGSQVFGRAAAAESRLMPRAGKQQSNFRLGLSHRGGKADGGKTLLKRLIMGQQPDHDQ